MSAEDQPQHREHGKSGVKYFENYLSQCPDSSIGLMIKSTAKRRKSPPRLPWKRGPAAWDIVTRAGEIRLKLSQEQKCFLSLRGTARLLGVSTQPIRDWTQRGYLNPSGKRRLIHKSEINRFVDWLCQRSSPFDSDRYLERIYRNNWPRFPFRKMQVCRFIWPKYCRALTPKQLSELVGCHPSLIVKAIQAGEVQGERKTNYRWEITRRAWSNSFPTSILRTPRYPPLPEKILISTSEVVTFLESTGMLRVNQRWIRELIQNGELMAERPTPGARKLFVTRESLACFLKNIKKAY